MRPLLATHAACTLIMVGMIWFVQLVHYPLMDRIGVESFPAWEQANRRAAALAAGPVMLAEAAAALLLAWRRPEGVRRPHAWVGLGLLALIWLSTLLVQLPLHARLAGGFDLEAHRALVASNWLRTAAWTARGLLALRMAEPARG